MTSDSYLTGGGIRVHRTVEPLPMANAIEPIVDALDARRGVLLASSYEYPGRYTRWDMGFVDPPLVLVARGRRLRAEALNPRGLVLLPAVAQALQGLDQIEGFERTADAVAVTVRPPTAGFAEEDRSRQPSVFSPLRALIEVFRHAEEPHLGLYGAFGYDLAFQFEPIRARLPRPADQRDLVLYLPDELIIVDHRREVAQRRRYDFEAGGRATAGLPREGTATRPFEGAAAVPRAGDHEPGAYAAVVRVAREAFKRGDLFEVVPGQTFFEPCPSPPSELFRRLRERNPAPYGFLMNLGDAEYLVGASPEMYVRVDGDRVETCPISGTIARGLDAIADAAQIQALLNSAKDESELTMCTDVDRNDKSRICVPGSVRVIGRRQIEMYARLIHTVDHVEGRLRPGFDALDAFLATRGRSPSPARRRPGPCSSSRTTSGRPAPGTAARSGSWASTATSIPGSPSAPSGSRTARPRCAPGPPCSTTPTPTRRKRRRVSRPPRSSTPCGGPAAWRRARGWSCGAKARDAASSWWTIRTRSSTRWRTISARPAPR